MKRLCSPAVLALLSILPAFSQSTNPPEQAKSHVEQLVLEGNRLLADGNINAALDNFRQAHNVAPDDIEALTGLARAESLHKDHGGSADMLTQAQVDYQTALASHPTAELYAELGDVLNGRKDYAAAINTYRRALDLSPQLLGAEVGYGNALAGVGDFDNAMNVYSRACAQSRADHPGRSGSCGDAGIADYRGWAYFKKGDCLSLSLAEKDFSEAVSLEPGRADLHGHLGYALMGEGMEKSNCAHSKRERTAYLEHAWSELRIAINLDSSNVLDRAAFVAVSEVLKRKPEYNGGIAKEPDKAELSQLLADHPQLVSPDSLESLESLQDAQISAENNKALAAAKEAVRLNPTDGLAWFNLGQAYMKLSDYASAEEPLKRALTAFLSAPPDFEVIERGESSASAQPSLQMVVHTEFALAEVCEKLHRKREAERYRRGALFIIDSTKAKQDR
jgi:tetratricopeptide (TPR) repeat protein